MKVQALSRINTPHTCAMALIRFAFSAQQPITRRDSRPLLLFRTQSPLDGASACVTYKAFYWNNSETENQHSFIHSLT